MSSGAWSVMSLLRSGTSEECPKPYSLKSFVILLSKLGVNGGVLRTSEAFQNREICRPPIFVIGLSVSEQPSVFSEAVRPRK